MRVRLKQSIASSGVMIPLDQVLDLQGNPKFKTGDQVDVVVEREETEGGYLVSHEKALRHKIWDTAGESREREDAGKGPGGQPREGRADRRHRNQGVSARLAD